MRGSIVVAMLLAVTVPAEAKYDPCRSDGSLWLAPSGLAPRNVKVWMSHFEYRWDRFRVRGPGVDRIVEMRRGTPEFLDLGVLAPYATYEVRHAELGWQLARFTTGAQADHAPPSPPAIVDVDLSSSAIGLDVDASDDTAFLEIEYATAHDAVSRIIVWRDDLPSLGRSRCGPQIELAAGAPACLSIRAIDLSGNRSEPTAHCTIVRSSSDPARASEPRLRFPHRIDAPEPSWLRAASVLLGCIAVWLAWWSRP